MTSLSRLFRLTLVHGALLALGCWSLWAQILYRTPSRYVGAMLTIVAAASTGLTVGFWLYAALRGAGATSEQLSPVVVGQKICALTTLAFCFYGLFLFTNGKFDLADPTHYATDIVRIGMEETDLARGVPIVWADVRSWRRPDDVERVMLRPDERKRLWGGQAVTVSVRPGFYGVHWISRIEADVEKRSRAILAMAPDAGQVRKDLAQFYVRLDRFAEGATAAREYSQRFPNDRDFPVHIAWLLTSRDRFAEVIVVLSDVAPRRQDAEVYMLLGYSLGMSGQQARGIPLLETARDMQPKNWWPHYALGWVYGTQRDYRRELASLRRAVELRPGLYDAEREIQRLLAIVRDPPTSRH